MAVTFNRPRNCTKRFIEHPYIKNNNVYYRNIALHRYSESFYTGLWCTRVRAESSVEACRRIDEPVREKDIVPAELPVPAQTTNVYIWLGGSP